METLPTTPPRKPLTPLIIALLAIAALLGAFQVGMMVGFRKATYAFRWGDRYHQMFAGPQNGFLDDFRGKGYMDAHGLFGSVMKVDQDVMLLRDKDDQEKMVLSTPDTLVRRGMDRMPFQQIPVNARVVVIGEPDPMGRVMARFIRLFDAPPVMQK